jgi:hypothetical protein
MLDDREQGLCAIIPSHTSNVLITTPQPTTIKLEDEQTPITKQHGGHHKT